MKITFQRHSLLSGLFLCGIILDSVACTTTKSSEPEFAVDADRTSDNESATAAAAAETPKDATVSQGQGESPAPAAADETAAVAAPTASPVAQEAPATDGRPRVVRYISVRNATLRAAPNDKAVKVGVLPRGERVMVIEEKGWGRISDTMFVKLNALSSKAVPRLRDKANWSKPAH